MKLNNRGFAISSVMYSSLILFLVLLMGTLTLMASRKVILDKEKNDIISELEGRENVQSDDTWLTGYMYRLKVIIDHDLVDSDLTHFPVKLHIDELDGADLFDKIGSNFYQIAVTEKGNNSQLYVEMESWDEVGNCATIHVSRDNFTISSTEDTVLYIYYSHIDGTDNTTYVGGRSSAIGYNVWDSNYIMVNHMSQDFLNSSGNSNNGTNSGTTIYYTLNGLAAEFDGTDTVTFPSVLPSTYTITTLFSTDAINGNILSGSNTDHRLWVDGEYNVNATHLNGAEEGIYGTRVMPSYGWAVFSTAHVRYDNTTQDMTLNINGNFEGENLNVTAPIDTTLVAGAYNAGDYFDGVIDEIRVSDKVRSDAWVKAEAASFNDHLYSFVDDSTGPAWLSGYTLRQALKIESDYIDEPLTNFPVRVTIPDALDDGTCDSFVFTEADGYSRLYAERDYNGIGDGTIYVSSPTFVINDAIDTFIYVYCKEPVSINNYYAQLYYPYIMEKVWDEHYTLVEHMTMNKDSSQYTNHQISNSGGIGISEGLIGAHNSFWGTQYSEYPSSSVPTGDEITVTTVANTDGADDNSVLDIVGPSAGNSVLSINIPSTGDTLGFYAGTGGDTVSDGITLGLNDADHTSPTTWQFTKDAVAGTMNVLRENTDFTSGTTKTQSLGPAADNLVIGTGVLGNIDEIWISDIKRSDAWLKAEYYSFNGNLVEAGFVSQK